MSPTKKVPKVKPKAATKKPAVGKPVRPGAAKAAEAPATRAAPRGESERRRAAELALARAKEKPAPKGKPARKEAAPPARKGPARGAGRASLATGDAKARLGVKHLCFKCGAKFYDLNKPEPLCPKCGADQRQRPKVEPKSKQAPSGPRRPVTRPMVPLLEDEEEDEVLVDDELDLGLEGVEEGGPDDFLEEDEPEEEEPSEP
jgi:uncharacterized protein (TIGR02300 family)